MDEECAHAARSPFANETKFVVAIPTLNEEAYIEACIRSLLKQLTSNGKIVVVDGRSVDHTPSLVKAIAQSDARVLLIENPRKSQSSGINLVARRAAGEANFLIRADAHALYPSNFIGNLMTSYSRADAQSVVIPMRTVGKTCFQRAVAAVQNTKPGNRGAAHRHVGGSRYIDHVTLLLDLRAFLSVDGYDEAFSQMKMPSLTIA